ncbi:MAG TPA: hypothetical protein VGO96_20285 [Pyrinomonadaceae bacterium]|jgi:hypothetical protein|nr:hypothetical protein [Pyrinomonadaceae bacterium]
MTGDEMERAIEFLLKSQAAFEARQATFKVEQEKTDQQIRSLSAKDQQTREFLDELSKIVAQNSQQIKHINNVLLSVVEGQQRNTEDIDALVKLVGGLIERKNGNAEN